MKAKAALLEVVWYLARFLVYAKRGLFFVFKLVRVGVRVLASWYEKTIGFAMFKIAFYFKRRFFPESRRGNVSHWYWFGERWVLQLTALVVAFFFIIPETRLYKTEFGTLPGRKTILYALVGPGEQDFASSDELIQETAFINTPVQSESWRQGSVIVRPSVGVELDPEIQYSTTINGAVVKPNYTAIQPTVSGTQPGNQTQIRDSVIEYEIKSGDVIGKIAQHYGVSVQTILSANNINSRSIIRPGNILKIPPGDGVMYVVAKGDTISKIAKLYSVSGDEILKFNNLNQKTLQVGKQILIPGAKKIPAKVVVKKPVVGSTKVGPVSKTPSQGPVSTAGYIWPSGARIITQYYGLRHTGVDIAGATGLPNYAARDGVVVKSQCGYNGGYGCYIILDHGNGVQTLYGHNSQLLVSPGEYVTQGQVIALLGSTGRSTGPHIHFEVRVNGHRANPLQFIRR